MKFDKKFYLGDIHGSWGLIPRHLKSNGSNICYIQIGDFGVGFNSPESESKKLLELNRILGESFSHLFILRGNHDDPEWFNSDKYKSYKLELINITFIKDYSKINIDGENLLFIGGAVSIDRNYRRVKSMGWWEKEVVNFDFEKAKSFKGIDRFVCHTAPDFLEPLKFNQLVYNFAKNDSPLLEDLRIERMNMTKLFNIVNENNKLKSFVYGHFHNNYRFYNNGCEFLGIDCDTFIPF